MFKKILISILILSCLNSCSWNNFRSASQTFTDPQVIELANAAKNGDTLKIDELLSTGVDINAMGKQNRDPLFWLFVMNRDTEAKKKGFKHLLKNGANPLHIAEDSQTVLHLSAGHKDPYYLKTILEVQPDIDIDFESSKSSWATPLMKALLSDRYENFKIILEHGTDIEKKNARGDTPLAMARSDYEFAYLLLQRGADYTVGEGEITGGNPKGRSALVWSIEALRYWPSMAIEHHGIDYREKVIEFLREKGVEVNPWYPEDHGFEP